MILELKSVRPMKSMYNPGTIKKLVFKDTKTKQTYNGYLDPKNPELYNTLFPMLKIGAHYVGYTWPNRPSINLSKLTLAAVQPIVYEQTSLFC